MQVDLNKMSITELKALVSSRREMLEEAERILRAKQTAAREKRGTKPPSWGDYYEPGRSARHSVHGEWY